MEMNGYKSVRGTEEGKTGAKTALHGFWRKLEIAAIDIY